MAIVFETPGTIDMKAFTTFGVNVKPETTNPIGYFGTGLKYAVAVILREGGTIDVSSGGVQYRFYVSKGQFRDKDFDFVRMKKRNGFLAAWRYEQLPFTLEFAKNWEMWQAFRELESNTRDENGLTYPADDVTLDDSKTYIIVEHKDFEECWRERHQTFLPQDNEPLMESGEVEIFPNRSKYLYYRGMRVAELPNDSLYTYNILTKLDLTEDRTIKYLFMAEFWVLKYFVEQCNNLDMIQEVLQAEEEDDWEAKFDWDSSSITPSDNYLNILSALYGNDTTYSSRAASWYKRYYVKAKSPDEEEIRIGLKRRDWRLIIQTLATTKNSDQLSWTKDNINSFVDAYEHIEAEVQSKEPAEDESPF